MATVDTDRRRPGPAGTGAEGLDGPELGGLRTTAGVQDAVLRVADLLARTVEPAGVLAAVTAEASRLLHGRAVTPTRLDGDRALVVVATRSGPVPVGRRVAFEPDTPSDRVLRRGAVVRAELGDLVRGILPTSLTHGGLRVGVESLVSDLAPPVDARIRTPRPAAPTGTTACSVVAEALTNAVEHSQAREVRSDVGLDGGTLVVEIRDDGVGGADPARGSGLIGPVDRVDAAGGTLMIISAPGAGTTVRAALPVG